MIELVYHRQHYYLKQILVTRLTCMYNYDINSFYLNYSKATLQQTLIIN